VRALALFSDEAQELDGTIARGPEPVRGARVELRGLPRFDVRLRPRPAGYRGAIDSRLGGVPDAAADTAREGVANGAGPQAQALTRAAQESFVDGWQQAMWAGAVAMAVLFVYVLARGPRQRIQGSGGDSRETNDVVAGRA
jgi:hypothetical protein